MRVCVENFPGLCCDRRFRTSLCPASGSGDDSNERFLVSVLILLVKIYTPLFGHVVVVVASLWAGQRSEYGQDIVALLIINLVEGRSIFFDQKRFDDR